MYYFICAFKLKNSYVDTRVLLWNFQTCAKVNVMYSKPPTFIISYNKYEYYSQYDLRYSVLSSPTTPAPH